MIRRPPRSTLFPTRRSSDLNSGRVVFGLQFGNMLRPKEYGDVKHPVPVDVPRVRYQLLTRRVGNSPPIADAGRSEEHTSELQSQSNLVCRLLLEKKKENIHIDFAAAHPAIMDRLHDAAVAL